MLFLCAFIAKLSIMVAFLIPDPIAVNIVSLVFTISFNSLTSADRAWSLPSKSLLSVKLDEIDQANTIFETLMGDVTEGRKNFIQENSLKVANLDI